MCHFMLLANIESSRWIAMGMVVKLTQTVRNSVTRLYLDDYDAFLRLAFVSSIFYYIGSDLCSYINPYKTEMARSLVYPQKKLSVGVPSCGKSIHTNHGRYVFVGPYTLVCLLHVSMLP
jgi:hypothetical protein